MKNPPAVGHTGFTRHGRDGRPAALAANWLAGAWDQNAVYCNVSPAAAHIEQVTLRWPVDLFQLPADSGGAFVTGATSDPFPEICRRAHAAGAWVHVDGAFGLWATKALSRAPLTEGIGEADSWATDAHKWLNVPYDSGLAFVRDGDALRAAMAVTAEYFPTATPYGNPADTTPELARRARGEEVWAALRSLGRTGLAELIERTCRHPRTLSTCCARPVFRCSMTWC